MAESPGPTDDDPSRRTTDAVEARERDRDARMVRGVRWRLVLFSGGATLVVLLLLGVAMYTAVGDSLAATSVARMSARADEIAGYLDGPGRRPPRFDMFVGSDSGTFAYVVDPSDDSVVQAPAFVLEGLVDDVPDVAAVHEAAERGRDVRNRMLEATVRGATIDFPARILSRRVQNDSGARVVQVVQDRTSEVETLDSLLRVLLLGGLLALVAASILGAAYATRALVPIRASLSAQRDALRRQREFAADASHELRTPLTIVRSSVEDLRMHPEQPVAEVGQALDDIDAEVSHMTSLVEDLLLLARSDSGALDLVFQPVELGDVATDAASAMMVPAGERGVRIEVDPQPVMVVGDPQRLRQVVTILVDNAVQHSPPGSAVSVRVRQADATARLVVEDEGPGIRPADLPHVFDRFWRAPGSPTGGTGLGLAIAATIVTRLGGRIGAGAWWCGVHRRAAAERERIAAGVVPFTFAPGPWDLRSLSESVGRLVHVPRSIVPRRHFPHAHRRTRADGVPAGRPDHRGCAAPPRRGSRSHASRGRPGRGPRALRGPFRGDPRRRGDGRRGPALHRWSDVQPGRRRQ
jgi:signal transduction histidine kinase